MSLWLNSASLPAGRQGSVQNDICSFLDSLSVLEPVPLSLLTSQLLLHFDKHRLHPGHKTARIPHLRSNVFRLSP